MFDVKPIPKNDAATPANCLVFRRSTKRHILIPDFQVLSAILWSCHETAWANRLAKLACFG